MTDTASAILGLALLLAAVIVTRRLARAAAAAIRGQLSGHRPENVLTLVAAVIATSVQGTGMWRFFGVTLDFGGPLRILLFSFIEIAQIVEALRARRNVLESADHSAGVDGIAVWALAGLSAVLSSLDARSFPEALFRLAVPLVAAWLWERLMAVERRRVKGHGINWRLTPERILVRLGLAEAADRTASDVDVHRRLHRVARTVQRLRVLEQADAGKWWRRRLARRRLNTAVAQADEHVGLATDDVRQAELLAHIAVLVRAPELSKLTPAAPWARAPVPPARPRLVRVARDPKLAAAEQELWSEVHALRPGTVPAGVPGEALEGDGQEQPQERLRDEDGGRVDIPEELRDLVAQARKRFHWEIGRGVRPSVRDLKKALGIGTDRAREVQAYLGVPEQERGA